jgi:hypothetical protein
MATIIELFPDQMLGERLALLREFLDDAEEDQLQQLEADDRDDLQSAIDHVWPGAVAIEQSWLTKLAFAFAGFAIGIGLYP